MQTDIAINSRLIRIIYLDHDYWQANVLHDAIIYRHRQARREHHLNAQCAPTGSYSEVPQATELIRDYDFISMRMPCTLLPEAFSTRPAGWGAMLTTRQP